MECKLAGGISELKINRLSYKVPTMPLAQYMNRHNLQLLGIKIKVR